MQEDLATSQQQRRAMTRYGTGSETANLDLGPSQTVLAMHDTPTS